MSEQIKQILDQRGQKYGPFEDHARITCDIKRIIHEGLESNEHFLAMERSQRVVILEAADMIAHKIGRIVNGDPAYLDSWDDIAGYATLVSKYFSTEPPF